MSYLNPPPGSYDIDIGFRLTHQQVAKNIKMSKTSNLPEKRSSSPGPGTYNPKSRLRGFKANPRIAQNARRFDAYQCKVAPPPNKYDTSGN